jgi:phage FluMu protein Com
MSKIKMRCTTCGKWFQSANAKEVTCPECVQKARKEKLAAKAVPPTAQRSSGQGLPGTGSPGRPATAPPKPKKPASGTSHWFDAVNDVKVSEPEPPPQRPRLPSSPAPREPYAGPGTRTPGSHRDERPSGPGTYRGPGAYRNAPMSGSIVGGVGHRPRLPMEAGTSPRGPRPSTDKYSVGERRGSKPSAAPKKPKAPGSTKPKKEKIPPPEPFKPTPEQIAQVEARYLELAVPAEFDGIRSQIARELSIPKKAVKQIVKALREREHIPSWWETQTYKGDEEEKAKIKNAYEPYLPVPPVGIHRKIADELDLKPGVVYQAIKTIRAEMNLPPYNDPELHAAEFEEIKRKTREAREAKEAVKAGQATAAPEETQTAEPLPGVEAQSVQVVTATGESREAPTEA